MTAPNVVRLADYREPPAKSQYDRYLLPFFDRERLSTWAVKPSGKYGDDCETGKGYALEFLQSCDGTYGWCSIMAQIVGDMIAAGPDGAFPDGHRRINGVVIGFMSTIGEALAHRYALLQS